MKITDIKHIKHMIVNNYKKEKKRKEEEEEKNMKEKESKKGEQYIQDFLLKMKFKKFDFEKLKNFM